MRSHSEGGLVRPDLPLPLSTLPAREPGARLILYLPFEGQAGEKIHNDLGPRGYQVPLEPYD
jgi:hypothetical protein